MRKKQKRRINQNAIGIQETGPVPEIYKSDASDRKRQRVSETSALSCSVLQWINSAVQPLTALGAAAATACDPLYFPKRGDFPTSMISYLGCECRWAATRSDVVGQTFLRLFWFQSTWSYEELFGFPLVTILCLGGELSVSSSEAQTPCKPFRKRGAIEKRSLQSDGTCMSYGDQIY